MADLESETDPQFKAIMLTFLFDMSIFLVELLVFFCIRNKRDKGNVLLNWAEPQNEHFREFDTNDLRPSMQKELQQEMKMLEAKKDNIVEAIDAKKKVGQAINLTVDMQNEDGEDD